VHLHYADGRAYLKSAHDTFDVIIVDVPDPQTAQLNRFYTANSFARARASCARRIIVAATALVGGNHQPGLAEFLRCINRTLGAVFPHVVAIPGETIHFFASTRSDVLTDDPHVLVARLLERNLKTRYVREYFIPFRMMPDRMEQVRGQLQPLATTPVNRDFSPIAYYFDVELWSAQFKPRTPSGCGPPRMRTSESSLARFLLFYFSRERFSDFCPLVSSAPAWQPPIAWPRRDSR